MAVTRRIAFIWGQFGPYHMDRCESVVKAFGKTIEVVGIEVASKSDVYAWDPSGAGEGFRKITLFPGQSYADRGRWSRFWGLLKGVFISGARHIFVCHIDQIEYFAVALVMRLMGRRLYAMSESKFDDLQRSAWREVAKKLFYLPYHGVLVGGARTAQYMRFLGFDEGAIATGYDTVGLDRVRRFAGMPPAPGGVPFAERHFTVIARMVEKKNLGLVIDAYRHYRDQAGAGARDLVFYGSGPLETELRTQAQGIEGLHFAGFVQAEDVARGLAATLALILPSLEEQWGLVVNEALALGVPALVTDQVGSRDSLVRTGINGYIFEPDNSAGLARLMQLVAGNENEWRHLVEGTQKYAPLADASRFAEGVQALTGLARE